MVEVNPIYRGNGIGRELTQMCIEFARKNNEQIIALHTSEFMDSARQLYETLGFKLTREIEPIFGMKYWLYQLKLD
ncbi:MAG: ribosomal protein S18 acetylase RimI-like enzyme [Granulosicoccus sp.]|jgi:ribosomal protein S18 acetylase RimI-like enzyme